MKTAVFAILLLLTSCSQTFYIVRHAEKADVQPGAGKMELQDPALSSKGSERAIALMQQLNNKKVQYIFSTNYKRTLLTATPLAQAKQVDIAIYNPAAAALPGFVAQLRAIKKGNVLIVGHSNTIDDLANALAGSKVVAKDLPETEYNHLFIIKRKGRRYRFSETIYGD